MLNGEILRDPLPDELTTQPALIEPLERQLLYNLAKHHCDGRGDVVELGAFLGASTIALAAGLRDSPAGQQGRRVRTYDCFECSDTGALAPALRRRLRASQLEGFLLVGDGRLDFEECFQEVIRPYQAYIAATRCYLSDAQWSGAIELLHIDLPKDYSQLRYVKQRFFPHLLPGAIVVHQDFLYHWSAQLIAATVAFIKRGILRAAAAYGTSLVLSVARQTGAADLEWLESEMSRPDTVADHIKRATSIYAGVPHAKAVIKLALGQFFCAGERRAAGEKILRDVVDDPLNAKYREDLKSRVHEMKSSGFALDMS